MRFHLNSAYSRLCFGETNKTLDECPASGAIYRQTTCRHQTYMKPDAAAPLSEPVLLILLSLAEQPRHGYSILKDVEEMSDGRVVLSTGTLYGALGRLLDDRWIERFEEREASRDRQAYRLTAKGKAILQAEVVRLRHLTRLASLRVSTKEA